MNFCRLLLLVAIAALLNGVRGLGAEGPGRGAGGQGAEGQPLPPQGQHQPNLAQQINGLLNPHKQQ